MENIINGGYQGQLYPINPRADVILGRPCYRSVKDIPGPVDIAIFCIPARFVAQVLEECGEKGCAGQSSSPRDLPRSGGPASTGSGRCGAAAQHPLNGAEHLVSTTPRKTSAPRSARPTTKRLGGIDVAEWRRRDGDHRLQSLEQDGGVGHHRLGQQVEYRRGRSVNVLRGGSNTQVVAMHVEDLKDGRGFAEVAQRVTKQKPVVVLKAGRTDMGARAAKSHTGALAGNDRIYDGVLRQAA